MLADLAGAFNEKAKSAMKTLELNCCNPRQIDLVVGDFGIVNRVKVRVSVDFGHRPVTQGIAGSSLREACTSRCLVIWLQYSLLQLITTI